MTRLVLRRAFCLGTTLLLALVLTRLGVASPPALREITYAQRTGNSLPARATLQDEQGTAVRLADIAGGKPLILVLGYYHCPNLCSVVRADLFHALQRTDLVGGRDYQFVSVSIDPAETPRDAASAKADDIRRFPAAGASAGWHFLTGRTETVQAIAAAVGFGNRRNVPQPTQFIHPAGIVFLTPAGVISSYLLGVGYKPSDVRLAVTRASRGTVQAAALPILLLCFDYHESTGRYTLAVMKLLRLAGALTVLTVGLTVFLAFRRDRSAR